MAFKDTLTRISSTWLDVSDRLAWLAPLATRFVIGLAFVHTGLGKWQHFERTVGYFSSLGIPMPTFNAGLVASMELFGGAFLIAGLLTRFMAAGLSTTMVVALLTADTQPFLSSWSSASDISPTDVTSFAFLLYLIWLVFKGAGPVSLDNFLARWLGLDKRTTATGEA